MANTPIHSMTDLWNSGGTTYYAIKMDVTNSASATGSKLFAMQIASANIFDVDKTGDVTMTSVDAGAAAGPVLTLYRNSATPAASDIIGKVLFQGEDSAGNTQDYAEIYAVITDTTSTSEDANLLFRSNVAGTMTTHATITATGWNGMNIGATTPGTGAFTTLTASSGYNGTVGAGTPAAGAFTTIAASGTSTLVAANLTGNLAISKASPIISLTATGTGSNSTITENTAGLTYAADTANAVASSFHIFTVDGAQKFSVGASAATFASGVSLTASGGGSLTGTWTDLGTVSTVDINGGTVDGVVIGGSSAAAGSFTTVAASSTLTAVDSITVTSADAGAGVGPVLKLLRNSASPAASDLIARLDFAGMDSGAAEQRYGDIYMQITDPTAGSEDATMFIRNVVAGTVTSAISLTATGAQIPAIGATTPGTGAFTTLSASSGYNGTVGAGTPAAGTFTTLNATGGGALTGTWTNLGTVTTIDINGGTIDGAVIGGASAAAGTFSAIHSGAFSSSGASSGTSITPGQVSSSVNTTIASTQYFFCNPNGVVGSISTSGSATTYATSSDYRLKTDVSDFLDSGAMIDALRPVSYVWKADNRPGVGFIAHEVQEVFSDAISGEKDGETMQGGDWSKLVPILVAELKSLRARVAELEAA